MGIFKNIAIVAGGIATGKVFFDMGKDVKRDYKEFNANYDAYKEAILETYKDDSEMTRILTGGLPEKSEKGLMFLRYLIDKATGCIPEEKKTGANPNKYDETPIHIGEAEVPLVPNTPECSTENKEAVSETDTTEVKNDED